MGHFVSGCACPGTDEVCFSGRSRFSPHTSPQRPGAHHRIKSVPKGCAACIGKCRSKGLGAFPQQAMFLYDRQPAHPQGRRISRIPDQHLVQLRPYSVHRGGVIRPPAKQSGIEQVFSKTTKQQELGVAVHAPAKSGIWMIFSATSKKAKRKAPYFKRSTVLFWWRIAGSNR